MQRVARSPFDINVSVFRDACTGISGNLKWPVRSLVRRTALLAVLGAVGACSLFVDTGGLDTETDDGGGLDGTLDVSSPDAGDASAADASDASDASAADAGDASEGGCPSGKGPEMVAIPGGFCIDSTEVTRGQYAAFLATSPSTAGQPAVCSWNTNFTPSNWSPTPSNYPVASVDWCDAYAFCKWAGKRMCGAIDGGPLPFNSATNPNQSQWYRACSDNAALVYPYGNSYVAGTCNAPTGDASIAAVKSFAGCQGGFGGLYDMAGNVEEWQDSCQGDAGPGDACRDQAGTFGYVSGDPVNSTKCTFLDTDSRGNHLGDLGIRCCYP